jgi:SOS-response transcriptional repressor LexA
MENKEVRRANMLLLVKEIGSLKALGDKTDTPPAYLSQIKNRANQRGMGDEIARRIERKLGKPSGWMDNLQPAAGATTRPRGKVPLISWVQAGDWCDAADPYVINDAEDWVPVFANCGPRAFALRVRGESMFNPVGRPSYEEGDIIIVDPDVEPRNRDRIIVRQEHDKTATFKQLVIEGDRRFLKALNPAWPEPFIEIKGDATICGVVVAKWVPER